MNCCKQLYVFDQTTGMWSTDEDVLIKILSTFTNQLHVARLDTKGEVKISEQSYGNTLSLMKRMPSLLAAICKNDQWLAKNRNSSLGMILFDNGYYNFHTSTFHDGFNSSILFMGKIHHHYDPSSVDRNYIDSIRERFFYMPIGEDVGQYYIKNLARALAGDMMKRFIVSLGHSNSGKSTLAKALMASLHGYVAAFSAENFNDRQTSNDEAQLNRPFFLLWYKRIIISNEVKVTAHGDHKTTMNGTYYYYYTYTY